MKRRTRHTLIFCFCLLLTPFATVWSQTVSHVIHVSVDGLRSDAVTILGHAKAPNFYRLRAEGAFTDNARTDADYLGTLPNHITQLTGRGVKGDAGHNFRNNHLRPKQGTLHANKGSYVASVFDVVHDHGLSTALFTGKEKFRILRLSYDGQNGAPDLTGRDDGRAKIDHYVYLEDTDALVDRFVSLMETAPVNYGFLHLRDPDSTGHEYYWDVTPGSPYLKAVMRIDRQIGKLLHLIETNERLAGNTVLIVTADHGGTYGSNHTILDGRKNYTIPFYVWGAGIPAGADLYALNPHTRRDPGTGRPPYSDPVQPIRGGDAGNLALALLGLGPIPGSTINANQDLKVSREHSDQPWVWMVMVLGLALLL